MKNKLLTLLFCLFPSVCLAVSNSLITDSIDTPQEVTVVNNNFRDLWAGKLDLHPGNITPKRDSIYNIGAVGNEWLNGYFDNVNTPSFSSGGSNLTFQGQWDGWVASTLTWTYISSSQFSVPADWTGVLQKGDKIKLTQTTAKYFYVTATAAGVTLTTVTVTGGSDYSLANAAITSPNYSKMSTPQGFPSQFNFTPSWTGFSVAPSGGSMTFSINGGIVNIMVDQDTPGTSNSTSMGFTAPVACGGTSGVYSLGAVYNSSAWNNQPGRGIISSGSTSVSLTSDPAGGAWANTNNKLWLGQFVYPL